MGQDENCIDLLRPEDYGWTEALSDFMGIDYKGFETLIPVLSLDLHADVRLVADKIALVVQSCLPLAVDALRAQKMVEQLRLQHKSLLLRRSDCLKRASGDDVEAFMREHDNVEAFMREHRQASNGSCIRIWRSRDPGYFAISEAWHASKV